MLAVGEIHFRVGYLVVAVGVLGLLRKPLRHPDRPGSRWLALTVVALALVLGSVGLYAFVDGLTGSLALFSLVMFGITLCFVGWLPIAVEFATGESASRPLLLALGGFTAVHLVVLVTNFLWVHELVYRSSVFVDASGTLHRYEHLGPLFWLHVVVIYMLAGLSTALFVSEWARASGLRRRQAGTLALALVPAFVVSVPWYTGVIEFPFDPTPAGAAAGIGVLTWGLYREEFLEVVPVGRETVIEEMGDAVVILDSENHVLDWNRTALDLFDPDGATVGMSAEAFFETVPREQFETFRTADERDTEVSIQDDGRERHFSVTLSTIADDGDDVLGRVLVVRDISALKRREQQLLEQNEHLDEFAAVVSHDLQGPLMELRASADRAVRTGDASHAEDVLAAADRMDRLVDNLLQLARAGTQVADTEPVALDGVARVAWQTVWTPDAALAIETDRTVVADAERLQQLFENLFRNAVTHGRSTERDTHADDAVSTQTDGGEDATLTVTVGTVPAGFYVADDGRGIPPAERERVFERGYTTAADGTGLGLGIVRQIAGAHGWSVRATGSEDGGTRIEVTGLGEVADTTRPSGEP
jgi:PAS domain S-box-containing protein